MGETEREELTFDQIRELREHGAEPVYVSFYTGKQTTEERYAEELVRMVNKMQAHWPFFFSDESFVKFDPQHPIAHVGGKLRDVLAGLHLVELELHGMPTTQRLAEICGIKKNTLDKYMNGDKPLTMAAFARLVDGLAAQEERALRTGYTAERRYLASQLMGYERAQRGQYAETLRRRQLKESRALYVAIKALTMPREQLQALLTFVEMADVERMPDYVMPDVPRPGSVMEIEKFDVFPPEARFAAELESIGGITAEEFRQRARTALKDGDSATMGELLENLMRTLRDGYFYVPAENVRPELRQG